MPLYGSFARAQNATGVPDRIMMEAEGLTEVQTMPLARRATETAQRFAPKLMGGSSRRFEPVARDGWFGVRFPDPYVWYQESGIRPFTMRSLEGKTIPMWVNDPTGQTRRANPRAETRTTVDGRTQVLIFRKAARHGQRKTVRRQQGGLWVETTVPASFPGAPGRIALRRPDGRIAPGNVGVRWRHPGMGAKGFIYDAITLTAYEAGLPITDVIATNARWT